MAGRWLGFVCLVAAGVAVAQQPPAGPPPGAAAPPMAAMPGPPPKPHEWPRTVNDKPISHYVEMIGSPDPSARWEGIRTLPYFGPVAARTASRQLMVALEDPDPGVRVNAILTLAAVGFDNRSDLPRAAHALRQSIKNTVPGSAIRVHAVACLGMMGTEAYEAMDAILKCSIDPSWETRDAAAAALGRVGMAVYPATPPPAGVTPIPTRPASSTARSRLIDLLHDPAKAVRLEAIQSLLLLGPPTPRDPDQYGKEAQPLVDEVSKRLGPGTDKAPGEKDPSVRLWLNTLVLMYDANTAPAALREMTAAVTSNDRAMRMQGLTALTVCGPFAAKALDEVRLALWAKEPEVAKAAVICIVKMGIDGRKAVGDLQTLAGSATDEELKKMAGDAAKMLAPGAVPGK